MALPTTSASSGFGYVVAIEGLEDIDLENAPERIRKFASRAVNATARRTRTESAREMRREVDFRARYLTGAQGRLQVARFASPGKLEATIRGRDRPTSLARFIKGTARHGKQGVNVQVAPGSTRRMGRAFVMKLKSENIGLAIRLRPGERVENKKAMIRAAYTSVAGRRASDANLYLLYGPSVDQVFSNVARDISPDAARKLEDEFARLVGALL